MPTTNPQRTPVVQEVYPASGAHYAAPGVREAYEQYGIPPIMYQRDPYATAAFRTYVDPYGQMSVQPLIGFPSRYPHVVSGVPTDSLARAMSVAGPFMAAPVSTQPAKPVAAAKAGGAAPARGPATQTPARSTPATAAPARPAMAPSHEPYTPPRPAMLPNHEFSLPLPLVNPPAAKTWEAAPTVISHHDPAIQTPLDDPRGGSAQVAPVRFFDTAYGTLLEALGLASRPAVENAAPGTSSSESDIPVSPALQRAATQAYPSQAQPAGSATYRIEVPPISADSVGAVASPIAVPTLTTVPAGGRTMAPAHAYSAGGASPLITPPVPGMAAAHMPLAAPTEDPVAPPPVYTSGYQEPYARTPAPAQPVVETAPANMGEYWSRIQARRMAEERALLPMLYRQLTAPLYTADAAPAQLLPSAVARPAAQQAPAMVPPAVYYPVP